MEEYIVSGTREKLNRIVRKQSSVKVCLTYVADDKSDD
jgi:hypothetical protein